MLPLGWLIIFACGIALRQVMVGRASNIGTDLHDAASAIIGGNFTTVSEVAKRRGDSQGKAPGSDGNGSSLPGTSSQQGYALIAEMRRLATAAGNQYNYGSTGLKSYDCSGLVWRALRNIGVDHGARFTTETFPVQAAAYAIQVTTPAVGDIVLWLTHMGVMVGTDTMFSALSSKYNNQPGGGIRESSVSGHGGSPTYWRVADGAGNHTYH